MSFAVEKTIMGPVVKIGTGELGGKARSLPFLDRMLHRSGLKEAFAPHRIFIPETWVLATDCFSEFIHSNNLVQGIERWNDEEVRQIFLDAPLPHAVYEILKSYSMSHKGPLAVRSSALSEDMRFRTTAGLFSTLFIPNCGPGKLKQLVSAVKLVYASAFSEAVNRYMRHYQIPREDERMAVALEPVIGNTYGRCHYPTFAGVAQSHNYFPVGTMQANDGIATVVMGMGGRVVSGKDGTRFCPVYPSIRPDSQRRGGGVTQKEFDAVCLDETLSVLTGSETETITTLPLSAAEKHGTLDIVASKYDAESEIFYDDLFHEGETIVSFRRLLKGHPFPLPEVLKSILQVAEEGFGVPVEIEFAARKHHENSQSIEFALLQARPLPLLDSYSSESIPSLDDTRILIRSSNSIGRKPTKPVDALVFVDPGDFDFEKNRQIAKEVAKLNAYADQNDLRYVLIGPGRWGSSNRAAGIPVRFSQIDHACVIVELGTDDLKLEPSQGSHFFHNMVSTEMCYMSVDTTKANEQQCYVDLTWLRAAKSKIDTSFAKWIPIDQDVCVHINNKDRCGCIYWNSPTD